MDKAILSAFRHFQSDTSETDTDFEITHITTGLAHKTYCLIHIPSHKKYIIQNLNPIFDFAALNHNLQLFEKVQQIYSKKLPDYWEKVNYLSVKNSNDLIFTDKTGKSWRVMDFIEGKIFNNLDNLPPEERQNLASSLGQTITIFGKMVNTIPVSSWQAPLPRFHDLGYHYYYLQQILNRQKVVLSLSQSQKPLVSLQPELYKKYEPRIKSLLTKIENRKVLVKVNAEKNKVVTHGDTKINNAIFKKDSSGLYKCACLIDLDTIQPGEALNDLGDALRSIGNLGNENPANISSVTVNKDIVTAVISGYFNKVTPEILKSALQSYTKFLYMLSLRFLADYLVGSKYFSTYSGQRPDLNLYRAEVQMATLKKLESFTFNV